MGTSLAKTSGLEGRPGVLDVKGDAGWRVPGSAAAGVESSAGVATGFCPGAVCVGEG